MRYHPLCLGKTEIIPKCFIRSMDDFSIWYTPGVAAPCQAIAANKEEVYDYTNKWNTVAVVSDGSRVLGLGNIGPEAALPVMEGKSLIFKYLGGVDAVPICLQTDDPDQIIQAVTWMQPSFGGINLEDIAQPKCFYILDRLRETCEIPVWHDDQQGTAAVILAGLINAVKVVGKQLTSIRIAMIGAGAAMIRTAKLLMAAGVSPEAMIMCDSQGILNDRREDVAEGSPQKWEMCQITNTDNISGGIPEAMMGADATIALSAPGPGIIQPDWIRRMAANPIVFACANPIPEIWPWEAEAAGAAVLATGRSDFPNQINNSIGFPGIFRGVLDVRAYTITDSMCVEAAKELARFAEQKGIHARYLVPAMDELEVFPREAVAVARQAIKEGVARLNLSADEIYQRSSRIIERAHRAAEEYAKAGFVPQPESNR